MAILSYEEARTIAEIQYMVAKQKNLISFLNIAARFPEYTKENICLILVQNPETTDFYTECEWKQSGTKLKAGAQAITVALKNKTVMYVYDVSQTDLQKSNIPPEPDKAYSALLRVIGGEPIELENIKNRIAFYDENEKQWFVSIKANRNARFYSIILILLSNLLMDATGIDSMLTTDMAAYMICKKYGIDTRFMNLQTMQERMAKIQDVAVQDNSIRAAMRCLTEDIFKDLDAYYSGQIKQRELERKQEAEEAFRREEERKKAEEKQIQEIAEKRAVILAEQMVQQIQQERRSIWGKWKRGGTG